jgi:DcuC family C4-dicarboxylate transporter
MMFEFVNYRKIRPVLDNIMTYFEGMGKTFALVVSLVICAETFALGLMKIGTVDTLIVMAQDAGLGLVPMILVISAIMIVSAFLMGSGNAAFFAFASIAPKVAAHLKVEPVMILLPMELTSGMGRCMSPIAAAIVAIATIAGVSPFQVVKRCIIPVVVAIVFNLATTYIVFL